MSRRVLIAEDDATIRQLYSLILQNSGYEVVEAVDGQEALDKFLAQPCDMVITDMNMPRMSGLELIQRLRRDYPNVYIMLITAYGTRDTRKEALHAGSDDYLAKPVELHELTGRVKGFFEK